MFDERLSKFRMLMQKNELDAALLISDYNRNYLSGFTGDESYSIITKDEAIFITDSRYTEQAKNQVKGYKVIQYREDISIFIAKLLKELKVKNVGFEEDYISYSQYTNFKNNIEVPMLPLKGIVEELRIVKDEGEIANIKKAAEIADEAFSHMVGFIKSGMTEREIGIELEFTMKKLGASDLSFTSIVASGVRSALPHGTATEKVVSDGEFLTLDFGCIYNDYCSDMTRTVVIGEPNEKMVEIYNVVLTAQKKALEVIKEGRVAKDVDSVARNYITEKGYGDYFGHGLGHGVGRQIHEKPGVNKKGDIILKAGMIITDEPGVYIPNFGGVRIEDLILVTENGCEILSKSTKDLICIK